MNKVALVTGIYGQDGGYLAKHLLNDGYLVYGMKRRSASSHPWRLEYLGIINNDRLKIIEGDMTDMSSLYRVVEETRPDVIYNTAAQSHVHTSFSQPLATMGINCLGVLNLLEVIKNTKSDTKILSCQTSEMYGTLPPEQQGGDELFHPRSPYGVSKVAAFWLMRNYREAYNMFTVNSICWNHEGPTRGEEFITRKLSVAVAKIKAGLQSIVKVGNLKSRRDWGHASDFTRGMIMMMNYETPEDWPLATGESHSIEEFAELAFDYAGLGDYHKYVEIDPAFFRPAEVPNLCYTPTRTMEKLGWKPNIKFEQLVREMVDADIKRYTV